MQQAHLYNAQQPFRFIIRFRQKAHDLEILLFQRTSELNTHGFPEAPGCSHPHLQAS